MSELTSAPPPPIGPADHVRGDGPEAVLFLDLACPHCAAMWVRIRELPLRLCFRHFPVRSKHRRAPALHAAAEAAGDQGAFWPMCDSLYEDQGHQDDPHLWERARRLGLDLDRFQADRRSEEIAARVRRDFESGIRAGVTGTPAAWLQGVLVSAGVEEALGALVGGR